MYMKSRRVIMKRSGERSPKSALWRRGGGTGTQRAGVDDRLLARDQTPGLSRTGQRRMVDSRRWSTDCWPPSDAGQCPSIINVQCPRWHKHHPHSSLNKDKHIRMRCTTYIYNIYIYKCIYIKSYMHVYMYVGLVGLHVNIYMSRACFKSIASCKLNNKESATCI